MRAVLRPTAPRASRFAANEAQRLRFWSGRKNAFPASGPHLTRLHCMDGTIPRRAWRRCCARSRRWKADTDCAASNVFHAGDGNLHPLILFDANDPDQLRRCELFGADILETCVRLGGTITGEHGVGIEKLNSMCVQFSPRSATRSSRSSGPSIRRRPAQSRQGRYRRCVRCAEYGAHARASRRAAVSRPAAVLMRTTIAQLSRIDRRACASANRATRTALALSRRRHEGASTARRRVARRLHWRPARHRAYEPTELVVTARAGTPLAELEAALADQGQCLAFDPPHFGPGGTLGGMVAAGLAGPARARAGAMRDFVLGATLAQRPRGVAALRRPGHEERRRLRRLAGHAPARSARSAYPVEMSLKVLPGAAARRTLRLRRAKLRRSHSSTPQRRAAAAVSASAWHDGRLGCALPGAEAAVEARARSSAASRRSSAEAALSCGPACASRRTRSSSPARPNRRRSCGACRCPSTAPPLALPVTQLIEWGGALRWWRTTRRPRRRALAKAARWPCDAVPRRRQSARACSRRCPRR